MSRPTLAIVLDFDTENRWRNAATCSVYDIRNENASFWGLSV